MNRTTMARRYGPLAALVAIQLLIIALAPSKAPTESQLAVGPGQFTPQVPNDLDGTPIDEGVPDVPVDDGTPVVTGPAGPGPGGGGGSTPAPGTDAPGPAGGPGRAVRGSVAHCVAGRQFDPSIFYWAPACVPDWTGANNGGETYQGVNATEIKIVIYRGKPNPAVDAILDASGSNPPDEDVTEFMKTIWGWINQNFEFYGRKVVVKEIHGECDTVPPDYVCLRGEMRDIVRREKPFLVQWATPLASPAFDELSALKVVNVGGWHFRDSFSQQRRPYHWDALMGGSNLARQVAEWYCKRLHGKKAAFAGETGSDRNSQNPPTNDIRNKERVLGVISTDDPENMQTIKDVLKPELAKCGASVSHEYYYAQDIARAEEQRRLGVAKMRENPESTTIMCFCDPVAPVFLYRTAQEEAYFPEHVVVGTGFMDSDAAGQTYDNGSTLCRECHQFENAFGLRSTTQAEKNVDNAASRLYKRAGGKKNIDFTKYSNSMIDLTYYMLDAILIQQAGPSLTPANVEKGAFAAGMRGGFDQLNDPHVSKRGFKPGSYAWQQDMDQVYWSQQTVSEFNGKKGAYVQIDGRRFDRNEYPSGDIPIPPRKPR